MHIRASLPWLCVLTALCTQVWATPAPTPARQDPLAIQDAVEKFLRQQSAGWSGETSVSVGTVDGRLNLTACTAMEVSLPPGSRPWGKTAVIVRCMAPGPWTVYVSATVKVIGEYVISARSLASGQPITAADIRLQHGELSQMPASVIADPGLVVGRTLAGGITAGSPIRQDMLRSTSAVVQNQTVKLMSEGRGFRVSTEAKALNNAAEGQLVQTRTPSGQVVGGVARAGGIVDVAN